MWVCAWDSREEDVRNAALHTILMCGPSIPVTKNITSGYLIIIIMLFMYTRCLKISMPNFISKLYAQN